MPLVTIDNKQISVPNGTLVVEAAKQVGIEIPVFCYHPKLSRCVTYLQPRNLLSLWMDSRKVVHAL